MNNHSYTYANRMKNEVCKLSFEVLSDLHVTLPIFHHSLDHALEDMWLRKQKHIVILGDVSSNGYQFQLHQCFKQLKEYPNTYLIALGNHDTYNFKEKQQIRIHPLYKELALKDHKNIYYDEYLYGYHFYVLNSERPSKDHAYYSKQQLYWLYEHLEKDDIQKPVFVCCHHPLKDTHLHSDVQSMGFISSDLLKILKKHPHVIYLSGHLHNSYEDCIPLCDETLFEINVPSFSKTEYGEKKEEVGFHIEIYHDFLFLRARDYHQNEWIQSFQFILDFSTHQLYRFDNAAAKAGQ